MSYELDGKLHKIFDIESKSERFQTRDFVVETDGQYPQFVKFQLTQDRCSIIEQHKEGEMIKVFFDLRGREWNEKYFTNLNAWRVQGGDAAQAQAPKKEESASWPEESQQFQVADSASSEPAANENFDDLPF